MLRHAERRRAGWSSAGTQWLTVVTLLLWLSGVGMFVWPQDAILELPTALAELRRLLTTSHGTASWLFCLLAGRWIWPHVPLVWRRTRHAVIWFLGIAVLGCVGCIAVSGLGLLYASPGLHELLSPVHWWLGVLWPIFLVPHALLRGQPRI